MIICNSALTYVADIFEGKAALPQAVKIVAGCQIWFPVIHNIPKLDMSKQPKQSDLIAHLIPHSGGDGQGVVPTQEELAQGMRKSSKHRR